MHYPPIPAKNYLLAAVLSLLFTCGGAWGLEIPLNSIPNRTIAAGAARQPWLQGRTVICEARFSQPGSARGSWDIPLSNDLSGCAGVLIRMRCINASLASHLTLHIRNGQYWHSATITPRTAGKWEELFIPRTAFLPEGATATSGSWNEVNMLRLSAWRGAPGAFQWMINRIEFVLPVGGLALIRTGISSRTTPQQRKEALLYARLLGDGLARGGFRPAVMDETELTPHNLKRYQGLIIPSPAQATPPTIRFVAQYLRNGSGKALLFYALPEELRRAAGMPQGKFRRSAQLPQPLGGIRTPYGSGFSQRSAAFLAVEELPPGIIRRAWWEDTTGAPTPYPAILASGNAIWMTHIYQNQDPARAVPLLAALIDEVAPGERQKAAANLLNTAGFLHANAGVATNNSAQFLKRANECRQRNDYPGVYQAVLALEESIADADFGGNASKDSTASTNATSRLRGAWLRSPTGLPGGSWQSTAAKMQQLQLNALFPFAAAPHGVSWPNATCGVGMLPGVPPQKNQPMLAAMALRSKGIVLHPWVHVLSIADAPTATQQEFQRQGRLQCGINGRLFPWLCPVNSQNVQLLTAMVEELSRRFPVDGIHLDMIRYESSNTCYCKHCRQAFARRIGVSKLEGWPECTLANGAHRQEWLRFRRDAISQLVRHLSLVAKKNRPKIVVSAAVFPEPGLAANSVAQDWRLWLHSGWVDMVAPMTYRPTAPLLAGDLARINQLVGANYSQRICPGIGVTTQQLPPGEIRRQIQTTRNANMAGFIIFELTP